MNEEATQAFLFGCDDSELFAVTIDREGSNLPIKPAFGSWRLLQSFLLGVQEPMPSA
jgi:hypothetical protein